MTKALAREEHREKLCFPRKWLRKQRAKAQRFRNFANRPEIIAATYSRRYWRGRCGKKITDGRRKLGYVWVNFTNGFRRLIEEIAFKE
ncbi:hypothetical protein [Pseudochelatococcus contaminans]|uniref:Uncharacterized protein n=1 Tax=Pseudochelatococcus contaminans TaxID=1538103 RepID=A0A7W5Z403_9HYPH|nr:hypothetical protein [Pseudochelatococcus contaminans]MBB3809357.1 hypothetical protein [Pseudochelatococcus contaminans]